MNHYRLDVVKYERHIAEFRKKADRVGQLLAAVGRVARATRAVREAVEDGRVPADQLDAHVALIEAIAARDAPDTIHRLAPAVEVDQGLLDGLVELLLESFLLIRFRNFVIAPGCRA